MANDLSRQAEISEMRPKITVIGVGGGGGNAVNNMIVGGLQGAEFIVANTDAQALSMSKASRLIQLGVKITEGLGAGSFPDIGRAAAEESVDEIMDHLAGTHMCFVTAGMGGGTGTGAAPVIARAARDAGMLTVAVVTKPFTFEGNRRMNAAEEGIERLREAADTVIVIPNQNLFRIADAKTRMYPLQACRLIYRSLWFALGFKKIAKKAIECARPSLGHPESRNDANFLAALVSVDNEAGKGNVDHAIHLAELGNEIGIGRDDVVGINHINSVAIWKFNHGAGSHLNILHLG